MSVSQTPEHWWDTYYRWVDTISSIAVWLCAWWLCRTYEADVVTFIKGDRSSLYGTLASIFGALLGFVITSFSIVIGFMATDRMKELRGTMAGYAVFGVYLWSAIWVGIATVVPIVGLICDRGDVPAKPWLCALTIGTTLAGMFAIFRCLRLLASATKAIS